MISEESLLLNIMVTAQRATSGKRKAKDVRAWMSIFSATAACLDQHPYATWGGMVKSMKRASIVYAKNIL